MSDINPSEFRTKLDVIPREVAATDKPGRRFQAAFKLKDKLTGNELIAALAKFGNDGEIAVARMLMTLERAEVTESDLITAKIVFHDPIPRGEYNLIVSTRCGDGRDYALRRIGHPVTVP